jgi:hypothetical protein
MSERARDKLLCSALVALAESNIKWSIAASVKTVETIQAIVNMTYWAPLSERQCDDPYWLRLTHVGGFRLNDTNDSTNMIVNAGRADSARNGPSPTRDNRSESRRVTRTVRRRQSTPAT